MKQIEMMIKRNDETHQSNKLNSIDERRKDKKEYRYNTKFN